MALRIAVTGLKGQVAESLRERGGAGVFAVGRPDLDLARPETVLPALAAARPHVIVNAAAYTAVDRAEAEPELAFAVNRDGARAVAEAAARLGVPLIHISTDYVFSGDKPAPYAEDDTVAPLGVYGRSKWEGEEAVRAAQPHHAILRTAWVYSPFGANFVKTMLRVARERPSARVVDDQHGNPTSALDIADGVLAVAPRLAADASLAGTYHMSAAGETTWYDFARRIFEISKDLGGPSVPVEPITTAEWPTPVTRPMNSRLDCRKFVETFGRALPDWKDGLSVVLKRLI